LDLIVSLLSRPKDDMMTLYKWGEINDRLKIETSDKVGPLLKFQDTVTFLDYTGASVEN
jgi:hypothetical protein